MLVHITRDTFCGGPCGEAMYEVNSRRRCQCVLFEERERYRPGRGRNVPDDDDVMHVNGTRAMRSVEKRKRNCRRMRRNENGRNKTTGTVALVMKRRACRQRRERQVFSGPESTN